MMTTDDLIKVLKKYPNMPIFLETQLFERLPITENHIEIMVSVDDNVTTKGIILTPFGD